MISKLQKDALQSLLHNDLLLNTVKQVFMEEIEKLKPEISELENNLLVGEKYRAYKNAEIMIEQCFKEMESHRADKDSNVNINRGR